MPKEIILLNKNNNSNFHKHKINFQITQETKVTSASNQ